MRNLIKSKKKKGFTLIEMVAVVAIIGILAAILVPKITGYMKEAKKTGVIDQARKVTQAFETAVMKGKLAKTDNSKEVAEILDPTMLSLLDVKGADDAEKKKNLANALPKLLNTKNGVAQNTGLKISQCQSIVEDRAEFNVDSSGNLDPSGIPEKPATP
ncbi:prepilin-type N-terminal cleavage/methylation domain-containing protein [Clostridium thermobutyricum]|uniref:Prepilin-type N-terminal cleavage/methylation domain-containing protein n=1 Tax=Clostridium thermobutyricum TaxID=29372 RepID=N9XXL6_9CLOT|nr:type II secretion system protein [Clostridium thermobutyricum]ENZ00639.1 prepilin-type N-terminal cleavage/methylation domain-containing protein [Clostridium thermobutyricum]